MLVLSYWRRLSSEHGDSDRHVFRISRLGPVQPRRLEASTITHQSSNQLSASLAGTASRRAARNFGDAADQSSLPGVAAHDAM